MLISVGNDSRHIYAEFFETPFLQHSTEFYQRESEKLLAENNASDYIRKVFARIHEESERAIYCFDKSTENRIIQVMEEELIRNHAKKVAEMENSGVVYMLKSKKWDDFTMMYKLFQRVPDCHLIIDDCVNEYIQEQRKGLTSENRDEEINHIRFVQNLFELKDVFEIIHKILLGDNQSVEQRIKFNFNNDINLNQHRTEYLLLVIENKLKKVPILPGTPIVFHFKSMQEQGKITNLIEELDRSTGELKRNNPRLLTKNSSGVIEITLQRQICCELYSDVKELGRFMLRQSGLTMAAGIITKIIG
ncbi:unnamed protein product [Rotaria sp. Silwood1]|nr:unnamed protein product [Rotaria sp. Silwood1]